MNSESSLNDPIASRGAGGFSFGPFRNALSTSGLEFVALVGFAMSPLYDLLGRSPEVLVANGFSAAELVAFCGLLSLALPLLLTLCETGLGIASVLWARGFHLLFVGLLAGDIALLVLSRAPLPWLASILASVVVGLAITLLYVRYTTADRNLLRFLSLAAVAFPAWFLFVSPASELLVRANQEIIPAKHIASPVPIVVLIMDEFPIVSLLDATGSIDESRYPEFADFAQEATWFPNAATSAAFTAAAVPAILAGVYPREISEIATSERYPNSLFSLLSDVYRFHSFEPVTQMCPVKICADGDDRGPFEKIVEMVPDLFLIYLHRLLPEDLRRGLPSVSVSLKGFAEGAGVGSPSTEKQRRNEEQRERQKLLHHLASRADQDLQRFLAEIEAPSQNEPILHFFHMLKPHSPFQYLPSGKSYPSPADQPYGSRRYWEEDPWEGIQAWQRHLLQVGYVDRQLGKILSRLREVGLYREALIAIVADHGVSFQAKSARRFISVRNQGETVLVPFFVKRPGQVQGGVDRRDVSTVDLLATIADVIEAELPWPTDGRSVFSQPPVPRGDVKIIRNEGRVLVLPRDRLYAHRDERLASKIEIFGKREGTAGLFEIGFAPELLGRSIRKLRRHPQHGAFLIRLQRPEQYRNVDLSEPIVPTLVIGAIVGSVVRAGPVHLAIAVNGRVRALTQTYRHEENRALFQAMIPESSLRSGKNVVKVFVVEMLQDELVLRAPMKGTDRARIR